MFGPAAKLHAANQDPPEVENEAALVAELRLKLGPAASPKLLLRHVRLARGKLHWAVNQYFREVFAIPLEPTTGTTQSLNAHAGRRRLDFEPLEALHSPWAVVPISGPKPQASSSSPDSCQGSQAPQQPAATASFSNAREAQQEAPKVSMQNGERAAMQAGGSGGSLDSFPVPVLELVFRHLDAWSVCQAAGVSKAFYKAAGSDIIWQALFQQHWGSIIFPTEPQAAATPHVAAHMHPQLWPPVMGPPQHLASLTALAPPQQHHGRSSSLPPAGLSGQGVMPPSPASMPTPPCPPRTPDALSSSLGPPRVASQSLCNGVSAGPSGSLGQAIDQRVGPPADSAEKMDMLPPGQGSSGGLPGQASGPSGLEQGQGSGGGGRWRQLFRDQALLAYAMLCPRCGAGTIVPIIYGFPSPVLMDARRLKRIILGGDHLIDHCHVWACTLCNCSFRTYPYVQPQLWLEDLALQQQRRLHGGPHESYTYEL